MLTTSNKKFET